MNRIYKTLLAICLVSGLGACTYDPYEDDITLPTEKLSLSASNDMIVLDENNLRAPVVTFEWTAAREMPDEYVLSYTTQLDVLGNNFGSTTVIRTDEETGIFSRSFTSEQLNNWANERWNLPVNKTFTLQFRVVAQWAGGSTFEAPEVRTVTVDVQPIHVDVFDADRMSLSGSAVASDTEIEKTVENENLYAWVGDLTIGELSIPVELEGETLYIQPVDGNTTLKPGVPFDVKMEETAASWNIPAAGRYRVLVNMETKQATIYTPQTDLQPFRATFRPNGAETNPETTIEVTDLWAYGAGTSWGVRRLNVTMSAADPQVLIYKGSFNGGVKFCIAQNFEVDGVAYNQNNVYCFTNPLTSEGLRQNLTLTANKLGQLHGGADGETRNCYYGMPSGTYTYIFDLRNMTILAKPEK